MIGVTPNALAVSYRVNASRNSILFVCMLVLFSSFAFSRSHGTFRDSMHKEYAEGVQFPFAGANKDCQGMRSTDAHV